MNADSDSLAQVDSNDPVIWSTRLRNLHTGWRRTIALLINLGIVIFAMAVITIMNRGISKSNMVSGLLVPVFLEGFGGANMLLGSFLNSVRLMQGMRLECTETHFRVLDGKRTIWVSRLDAIGYIAVLASRNLLAAFSPKMILIQTDADSQVSGVFRDTTPEEVAHEPPFLAGSERSLLIPHVFDISVCDLTDRISRNANLTPCQTQSGVPSGLRAIRSWSRSTSQATTCRDDPAVLQRWRLFAGVCPVCRIPLPLFQGFSISNERICSGCGTALRRHSPRVPVALTAVMLCSMTAWTLDRWLSLALLPYLYGGVYFIIYLTILHILARRWSQYSAVTPAGAFCRECGYDLRGCAEGRCSECGTPTVR